MNRSHPTGTAAEPAGPEPLDHSASLWEDDRGPVARRLLGSGVRCFAANGYHATTTRDITSAIDLSPGALYVHFASKEALLFEIVRTAHLRSLEILQDLPPTADAADHLRELVQRFVIWHANHHVAGRVSQYELAALTDDHHAQVLGLRRQSRAIFRDAVAEAVTAADLREVDAPRVARAILSLGIDLVRWYQLDGTDSPEQLGAFYADLALRMLTAPAPAGPAPSPA